VNITVVTIKLSLENQYSVHNTVLHLHFNFQGAITKQDIA